MAEITAALVGQLRRMTNAGLMDCKKALTENGGDLDAAVDFLRKKGIATAAKKAGRTANEGVIAHYIRPDGKLGLLVEVNCETDFAAGTEAFIAYANGAVAALLENKPSDVEAFQSCVWADGSNTVEATQKAVFTIGENIRVRRFQIFEAGEGTHLHYYIHGKRLGTMVEVQAPSSDKTEDVLDEICLHIVSTRPEFVNVADIPNALREKEEACRLYKYDPASGRRDNATHAREWMERLKEEENARQRARGLQAHERVAWTQMA